MVLVSEVFDRLREGHGKVGVVGARPTVGDAVACNQGVVFHTHHGPKGLSVIVVDAVVQVHDDASVLVLGEGVFVDAHSGGGGEFGLYLIVVQCDLIVSGHRFLGLVGES